MKPGWKKVRFGEVVRNMDENERNPVAAGLERLVGLEHLDPESLHLRRWSEIHDDTSFTRVFRRGQMLFGKRRSYQRKAALAEFDGICSSDILVFEARKEALEPDLLPFLLQSEGFFQHAMGTSAGSMSPRTKWKDLALYEFSLPPRDEQRRNAELLWAIDLAIEKWKIVTNSASRTIKLFFDESTIHEREWCTLGDAISKVEAGKSPNTYNRPALQEEHGVLKVSAVGHEVFQEHENKALLNTDAFNSAYEVKEGDLLVTRANASVSGVGRACIVRKTRPGLMLSDKTWRLILKEDKAISRFILQALHTKRCRDHIEKVTGGTEAKNISQAKLLQSPLPLPNIDVQRELVEKLDTIQQAASDAQHHISILQNLQSQIVQCLLPQ